MTATYDNPTASDKDAIRFLIGDTNPATALVSDEEINFMVSKWMPVQGTVEYVAAAVAEAIGAKYAREASFSADGVSVSLAQLGQQFRDLAANLRAQHKSLLVGGLPDAGGVSSDEQPDPEIASFNFGTGMHDDVEAGRQEYGSRGILYPAEYYPGV